MCPLVTELVGDPAIAVLRGDIETEELDPHPRDLFDERWVVEEPPAPEDVQVGELSGGDAEGVLVLACEHRADEPVGGECITDILDRDDICGIEAVASHPERGVHVASNADHHGEGLSVLGAVREYGLGEDAVGHGVVGEAPFGWQRDHGVG